MYFVYIIECSNKALYTGITNDLQRRFAQHQTGKGGHYTAYNPAVKLRYYEEYSTRNKAAKREAQIKSWSRTKKLALIKGDKGFLKAASRCKSRQAPTFSSSGPFKLINRFACPLNKSVRPDKSGQGYFQMRSISLTSGDGRRIILSNTPGGV